VSARTVAVNRAPVLTLWAAVVAERLGFDRAEALSLGRAVAGLNAQSKGRKLGLFDPAEEPPEIARSRAADEEFLVDVCGRAVPAVTTPAGVRAVTRGAAVDPAGVEAYLAGKFGDALPAVRAALEALAANRTPAELARAAYPLYERFRPAVPEGRPGWGAKGQLDLELIRRLAAPRKPRAKPAPKAAVARPGRRG
jgi:hypothetical protein